MRDIRGIRLVILFSGFLGLLQGIQRFLMPIALIQYGWDLDEYALVYIFQALSMGIPFLFGGFLSDLRGRRITIGFGFLLFSAGMIYLLVSITGDSILAIVLAQMLVTLSSGFGRVGLSTLMVDITNPGQDRTHNMGRSASLQNFLSFLGPIGSGFLISGLFIQTNSFTIDWQVPFSLFGYSALESGFVLVGILGLFGVSTMVILPPTSKKELELNRAASFSDYTDNQKKMQKAFLVQEILIGVTSGAIVPFIDYYILTEFQPDELTWGIVFGLSNSTIAIGNLLVGKYSEGFGKGITIVRLNLLAPLFALGIAFAPTLIPVSLFYVLRSGVANSVHPAWQSWYFSHTLNTARGRSFSVVQVSRRIARAAGVSLGPGLFGVLGVFAFPVSCLFYPIAMFIPYKAEQSLGID